MSRSALLEQLDALQCAYHRATRLERPVIWRRIRRLARRLRIDGAGC